MPTPLDLALRHHLRGWQHFMRKDFDSSLVDWREALKIREIHLGNDHAATKETCDLIGCVLQRMAGLDKSKRKRYLKALPKSVKYEVNGDECAKSGKWDKALKEFQKSLDLEAAMIGQEHPICATLHRKMNICGSQGGHMDRSILLYCDALAWGNDDVMLFPR
jgi:tetratricopeptide (TPR) repeat protein